MNQVCPKCRQPQQDELLVTCEQCKVPFVDEASLKLSLSADELRQVSAHILSSWKFWTPFSIGLLTAAWLVLQLVDYATGRKVQDVIDEIEANVSNSLEYANARMTNEIAGRFEDPRIDNLVREVANEQASTLMVEQITPEVTRFKDDVAGELKELQALVEKTRTLESESQRHEEAIKGVLNALEKSLTEVTNELAKASSMRSDLKEISDFTMIVIRALGDDITAYDELSSKAGNVDYRFGKEAIDVICYVQNRFVGPRSPPFTVMPAEMSALAEKADTDGLKTLCGVSMGMYDGHLSQITWGREDLSKYQKLDVLSNIVQYTKSATARAMAGKHFAEESEKYFGHMRKTEWLDWWKENQARIKKEGERSNEQEE